MSPESRHLRYFVAVAEELSFTRAAARLNIAQQALSVAIQQLERELGAQLLVRTSRRVELTDAGCVLLDRGRRSLDTLDRSWEVVRVAADAQRPELRVAYTLSIGPAALPVLHDAMLERLPDIRVTWWELWCTQAVTGVATGKFDVGIARHPDRLKALAYETVAQEPQVVVVGANHELATADALGLDALCDETLLTFPREMAPGYHDAMLDTLRQAGVEPRVAIAPDTGHAPLTLSMLEAGAAVALAPIGIATHWARTAAGRLALVPVADDAPLPLHVFWNPAACGTAVEQFVELAQSLGREGALTPVAARTDKASM